MVLDLAIMSEIASKVGTDPSIINPAIPVDLIIDHSIQVNYYSTRQAYFMNLKKEYERNVKRYALIKWAQKAFKNFKVVPLGKV